MNERTRINISMITTIVIFFCGVISYITHFNLMRQLPFFMQGEYFIGMFFVALMFPIFVRNAWLYATGFLGIFSKEERDAQRQAQEANDVDITRAPTSTTTLPR